MGQDIIFAHLDEIEAGILNIESIEEEFAEL